MNKTKYQRGVTLIELMVAVSITMFLVAAAAYVYLSTRETQRAIERSSSSTETGAFALQILGRDILNAGFYPASMPPIGPNFPNMRQYDSYPPAVGIPPRTTDWPPPTGSPPVVTPVPTAYAAGIYGCDGASFNHIDATCGAAVAGAPDSLVINYFTNEPAEMGRTVGQRFDCTGSDVGNDPWSEVRRRNNGTPPSTSPLDALPPQAPLFVSNRYTLTATSMEVDRQAVTTKSLACSGNGSSFFGTANSLAYQPLLAGIEDLQFTYGVFNTAATRAPERFYTATEVNALLPVNIDGVMMAPWSRVVAVRVCMMTRTLGDNPKIADKTGSLRTYVDCADQTVTQPATDTSLRKRHVQVFGVRNRLNQGF